MKFAFLTFKHNQVHLFFWCRWKRNIFRTTSLWMARQIVTQYAHRSNTGSPRPFVFHESNKAHQGRTIRPDLQLYYGNRSGLSDGDLLGDQTCLFTRQRTLRLLQSSLDFLWSLCFQLTLFHSRLNLILYSRMFYRHNNVKKILK